MDELIEAGDSPRKVTAETPAEWSEDSPSAEIQPAPSGKKRMVRAAIAAVVVVVLGVGGYLTWSVMQANAREADARKLASTTKAADTNLAEIWDEMDVRERTWLAPDYASVSGGPALVSRTLDSLDGWDATIIDIEKTMRECPDEKTASAYRKIVQQLRAAIHECRTGLEKTGDQSKNIADLETADTAMIDAAEALNDAIDYCNVKKWSNADTSAATSVKNYEKAASLYKAVRKSSGDAELDYPVKVAEAYAAIAKMQVRLSAIGRSGGVESYNAQIRKMQKASDAIGGDQFPEYMFDGGMEDAAVVADSLFAAGERIQDSHDAAKELAQAAALALR